MAYQANINASGTTQTMDLTAINLPAGPAMPLDDLPANSPMFISRPPDKIELRRDMCEEGREEIALALTECLNIDNAGRVYWVWKPSRADSRRYECQRYRQAPDLLYIPYDDSIVLPDGGWTSLSHSQRRTFLMADARVTDDVFNSLRGAQCLPISISECGRVSDFDNRGFARIYETIAPAVLFVHRSQSMVSLASTEDMTAGARFRVEGPAERARNNRHNWHKQDAGVVESFRVGDREAVVARLRGLWEEAAEVGALVEMGEVMGEMAAAWDEWMVERG